jgi:hypothetical protein
LFIQIYYISLEIFFTAFIYFLNFDRRLQNSPNLPILPNGHR